MAAKLDVAFYPHIFDQILTSCDDTSLRALRGTCRRVQNHIDAKLSRHVVHDACGRAWGGPEAYSYRGGVYRSSWPSPNVLDILHWNEGLFPDPGERNDDKAKAKAAEIEREGKLAWWRNARLVRLFPDEDVIPFSRKAMVVRFVADPRLPSSGPAGQIQGVKSVWLSLSEKPFIGTHDDPPEPEVQAEPRFILNFTYHLNEFPRISVRRSAEDGPPESQLKLCVIVFTPGGEEEDDKVRANERAWQEWKREMEQQEAEARRNAQMDEQAIAELLAEEEAAAARQISEEGSVTTDGETDDEEDEEDESGDDGESVEATLTEEAAALQAELDLVHHPHPPVANPALAVRTAPANAAIAPLDPPPVPLGKERIKLTSMRAFWGLLRFFDAYTMGPCEGHGLQGDWHEIEPCSRVSSLLSYIIVGTERWAFDLSDVADDVPPDEGVEFDTAAWVADVDALRAERPDTPDFQLMVEAGLARWYEPSQAEVYNNVLDHVFYESETGFRNRYQSENYDLIMNR